MGLGSWFRAASAKKAAEAAAFRAVEQTIRGSRRHYEAASNSHRTQGWRRSGDDAVSSSLAVQILRNVSRDLNRNNGWARNANRVFCGVIVGWGIRARKLPAGMDAEFKRWAESTACHVRGKLNFYGIQRLLVSAMNQSGGVLIVRRMTGDRSMPLQLDVLEPDYIDTSKSDYAVGKAPSGNRIRQGIEFDKDGKVVAYWLKDSHPGAMDLPGLTTRRVPAEDVLYIYDVERPEQIHGIPWLCAAIVKVKEFDEYSDARLLQQKIAACFGAFVRDPDGDPTSVGVQPSDGSNPKTSGLDSLEPGLIKYLRPGEDVSFATPPSPQGTSEFSRDQLREIAAALGMPYEDLTGDFSNANYSTLRAGRVNLRATAEHVRWNILVPQALDPVVGWFADAYSFSVGSGARPDLSGVEWTPPPTQLIDPDKEGPAYRRIIRAGLMTPSEAVAEMGKDPERHWAEFAADLGRLDDLGIVLDSDPRKTTDTGQKQMETPAAGNAADSSTA